MSEREKIERKRRLKERRQIRAHQHFSEDLKHVYLMKFCLRNPALSKTSRGANLQRDPGDEQVWNELKEKGKTKCGSCRQKLKSS